MTGGTLAGRIALPSLGVMKPLKYDHAIWERVKADRDHALANPSAPRPNWMIGRTGALDAFMLGFTYVVYRKSVPLRPLTYGTSVNIDLSTSSLVRAMLDRTQYALARRPPFVTGQGAIRAVSFSDIIDMILDIKTPFTGPKQPPSGGAA